MNDDVSPPPAVNRPAAPRPAAAEDEPTNTGTYATEPEFDGEESPEKRIQKRVYAQTKRKAEFVHDIIINLDMIIYAELCILYYLDCSLFRLLIRALTQGTFLTPNPRSIQPMAKHRPYIPVILGANAICFLLHLVTSRPEAGEATRGYLHGGLMIDFIGQKGPTSKLMLLILDMLVLALQCFMLAVHVEQVRLNTALASGEAIVGLVSGAVSSQDHDSEERGMVRDAGISSDDIEMQQMASSRIEPTESWSNEEEQDQLLAERTRRLDGDTDDGPLDLFYSGNVILADFHILHTLRTHVDNHETAAATAFHAAEVEWARVQHRVMSRLDPLR